MSVDSIVTGRAGGGRLLFCIIMALCLAIMYAPVLYLLLASLNPDAQLGLVPPSRYSLTWYSALLEDRRLADALKESALVALATAALATPIGLSAALAYRAMTRMRGLFLLIVLSAMLVPGTIEGLSLSAVFKVVGLIPSWVTITIGHLVWTLPFTAVVSLIGLSAVKPSTIAAARDLGAGPMRAFVDVTLPLLARQPHLQFRLCVPAFAERARARLLPRRPPEHSSSLYVRRDEFRCLADHLRIFRRRHCHLGCGRRRDFRWPGGTSRAKAPLRRPAKAS